MIGCYGEWIHWGFSPLWQHWTHIGNWSWRERWNLRARCSLFQSIIFHVIGDWSSWSTTTSIVWHFAERSRLKSVDEKAACYRWYARCRRSGRAKAQSSKMNKLWNDLMTDRRCWHEVGWRVSDWWRRPMTQQRSQVHQVTLVPPFTLFHLSDGKDKQLVDYRFLYRHDGGLQLQHKCVSHPLLSTLLACFDIARAHNILLQH